MDVAPLAECLPSTKGGLGLIPSAVETEHSSASCNLSPGEEETGGSEGQDHPLLCIKLETRLEYMRLSK